MSFLSRLFPSKAQKAVDALQHELDRRLLAVQSGLELFKRATDVFETCEIPEGSLEDKSFRVAQGKHAYFTNALIDDLSRAEELIEVMRRSLEYNGGRPQPSFAKEVIEAENYLADTDANVERLHKVTQEMQEIVGLA